ncbi:TonB-dependent siderophore receptor [Stutzerimonas stutzeri]|uniref:TonB-dependent siderophore receptor n=1 Tax=Stutzerimonas stutzeri TaxID=316 RepID=A0A2S4AS70_STUST|nr:catecholate siderophore receptor Fiu [Stutzerimonas stutzeri]MCQ4262332.1 catecholate siderophore receptor Fiu [Stutzerimonas stutzeri]POH83877.1 TonB-dependent siderophore receptor [Stutzerimonas stutzeri]
MTIRSRKHHHVNHLAALIAATLPALAVAQASEGEKGVDLPEMVVTSKAEAPYKASKSANTKLTQPLLDTPKTVQVIKKEMLREQGANSLMEALRNTPGITMQLGENGNTAAGDTFMMRGFSTQQSTFVDGVRDLGAVSRDVFNLEQVEVVKGAAGSDIGRGASSGYINLISKLPTLTDEIFATVGYGTSDKSNLTADINRQLGDSSAFRLNLMRRDGDVDGRDYVDNSSYGVAPSLAFGLDTPTRVYLYSQHVRQDNTPDGGIPTIGMNGFHSTLSNATQAARLNAGGKVDSENYYGAKGDYERIDGDMFTIKIEHDVNDALTVRNLSRWGRSNNDRVLTGINAMAAPTADPGSWTVSRSRQVIDQENEILANQTSLNAEFDTFGLRNELAAGLELMSEKQLNRSYATAAQTIDGVAYPAVPVPPANLYDPSAHDALGDPYKTGAYTDGQTKTAALYVFDTLHLNQQWALNGGVRFEHFRTETDSVAITAGSRVPGNGYESGDLTSWNTGVVFKPLENGSIYLSYANSMTPPGSGNFNLVANTATSSSNEQVGLEPQETRHVELGTKWDLLDQRLALTLAAYRTENENQVSYDSFTAQYFQEGKTRVDGIELGVVGQLSNFWQVSAGIAHMKTKQIDQASFSATNGVTENTGVRWSPDLTATLWTSYTLGDLTLGGGARYVSEQDRVIASGVDRNTQNMPEIPSYWVADAMAAYRLNKNVNLRLNVYNLFDKEYIESLNNSGARARLGTPRSAMLTTEFTF